MWTAASVIYGTLIHIYVTQHRQAQYKSTANIEIWLCGRVVRESDLPQVPSTTKIK